jgi:hypothetical protein
MMIEVECCLETFVTYQNTRRDNLQDGSLNIHLRENLKGKRDNLLDDRGIRLQFLARVKVYFLFHSFKTALWSTQPPV